MLDVGIGKNVLDREMERSGDAVAKIERRGVSLGFHRIDCLARYADQRAKLLLGPVPFEPKDPQPTFHGCVLRTNGVTRPKLPQNSG